MSVRFFQSLCLIVATAVSFAACADAPDAPAPADVSSPPVAEPAAADSILPIDPARLRAFDTALDTLDALVRTLERVDGPIAAWNRADEAARRLRYLGQNRGAFALNMTEAEAARRYPGRVGRLNALEARRAAELKRINEDPATARVFLQEIANASAVADSAGS